MMEYELQTTVFFHFIGFGLIMTLMIGGLILEMQYRNVKTLQEKGTLLAVLRKIGILSPIAVLIMLVTGIGNMHALALGVFTFGWLTAKIIFFAIASTNGMFFGVIARKRGALIATMIKNEAPQGAENQIRNYDKQITMFYLVLGLLNIIILSLAVYGRHGGGQ